MKTNERERTTGYNSGLAKVAVQCSADTFVVNQIWFSASTFVVKIAIFAKPQNVTCKPIKTTVHKMNDITRQQMRQRNHQTADPKANASVSLFFSTAHFLKTIIASRTNGTFAFAPPHKANPSAKAKEPFFSNAQKTINSIILN